MPPILIVEDRDSLREMLRTTLEAEGYAVHDVADGQAAREVLARERLLAVVTDLKLPAADGHAVLAAAREADQNLPVIVMTAYGTVEDAVEAMRNGAVDFLAKPVDPDHLLLLLERAIERRGLLEENLLLKQEFAERLGFPRIIGESAPLIDLSRRLQKAAPTDATVLLLGESGTGKELFARAAHHMSRRAEGPFVAVNCAAIPETLIENELFGHDKGAYTGADSAQAGRVELADRGTLFLDEIGELSAAVQAKLLRVLQDHTFERVGGTRTRRADLRVVAATNRDLQREVAAGRFREDLFYRLAVVTLEVPPLRRRRDDIPALAEHFLERFRTAAGRPELRFAAETLPELQRHDWPGNVRELENAVERAVILAEGPEIAADQLGIHRDPARDADLAAFARCIELEQGALDEVSARARELAERLRIRDALAAADGNKTRAAELLGVNYKRLLARVKELGLDEATEP